MEIVPWSKTRDEDRSARGIAARRMLQQRVPEYVSIRPINERHRAFIQSSASDKHARNLTFKR